MTRWILLVVALAQQSSPATPVVERGRVGTVAIGGSADAIYDQYRDRIRLIDLKHEGMLSPALELKFGAQVTPSLIVEIGAVANRLVVTRISVVDPSLRTREAIGVGSTYGDLRSRYHVDWVGSGEDGFYARVEALAMSFRLDTARHQDVWRDPAAVPRDLRIVAILLTH